MGSVLRPHASVMWQQEEKAREILDAAEAAGYQLATTGTLLSDTLAVISQPLTSEEEYRRGFNETYLRVKGENTKDARCWKIRGHNPYFETVIQQTELLGKEWAE
ncbi:hypothetical protein KAT59_04450 [Candidatus Bipolaricaulota bacterium]|nr:hypothetical protein [Candidatus Bipolaricaulota bacterium]